MMACSLVSATLEMVTASVIVVFATTMNDPQAALKYISYLGVSSNTSQGRLVFYMAICVGGVYVLKNLFLAIEVVFQNFTVQRMCYIFKEKLLQKYAQMGYGYYLTRNSSFGLSVVGDEVDQLFGVGVLGLGMIFSELMVFTALIGMVVYMDPSLAVYIFVLLVVCTLGVRQFVLPAFYRWGKSLQESSLLGSQSLMQFFHGYKEVILFGKKDAFVKSYTIHARQKGKIQAINTAVNSMPRIFIEVLFVGIFVSAIAYMGLKHDQSQQMLGVMGGYLYLGFRVMPGLNRIIGQLNSFKTVSPYVERVYEEYVNQSQGGELIDEPQFCFRKSLSILDVSFQYLNTERMALQHIAFDIQKGDCIGIVGETGSGKSTLVDLILGLLKPTSGRILIDGTYSVTSKQWHQIIGYVPQLIYLTDDTIEANIAFGESVVDKVRLEKAIYEAQLDQLVSRLAVGVQTLVGERGIRLSGGERQRIAIARALYRNPEVLIFDEATSALDNDTEAKLMETINAVSKDRTVIMIAHRLTTLKACDRIVVMDKGTVQAIKNYESIQNKAL